MSNRGVGLLHNKGTTMKFRYAVQDFLRKTYLWVIVLPFLIALLGVSSNQVVLIANSDTFPVMINPKKAAEVSKYDPCTSGPDGMDQKVTGKSFSVWNTRYDADLAKCPITDASGMLDESHCWMNFNGKKTHLNALADIIDVQDSIMSIGDVLIVSGFNLIEFGAVLWVFLAAAKLYLLPEQNFVDTSDRTW
jgi:hypothetical protein